MAEILKKQIYEAIQNRVLAGKLQPGSRVSAGSLAKELGVSRTPVRDAIGQLVYEGLVEHVPNEGTFLKKPSRRDLEEVYELREWLESSVARRAAGQATPSQIVEMERACTQTRAMVDELRKKTSEPSENRTFWQIVAGDLAFHMALIRASGNRRAATVIGNNHILSQIWGYLQHTHYSPDLHGLSRAYDEHLRIIRCIRRRDADEAAAAMTYHIRKGCEHLLSWFDRAQQQTGAELAPSDSWADAVREYDRQVERHI